MNFANAAGGDVCGLRSAALTGSVVEPQRDEQTMKLPDDEHRDGPQHSPDDEPQHPLRLSRVVAGVRDPGPHILIQSSVRSTASVHAYMFQKLLSGLLMNVSIGPVIWSVRTLTIAGNAYSGMLT